MSQPAPRRSGRVSARLELASDATVDQEIVHGQQMEKKKRPAKRVKVEESIEAAESVKKEEPSNSFAEPNLSRSDENNGSLGAPAKKRRNTKAKNSEKVEIKDEPPESVSATKGKRASKKKAEAEPMPPRVQGSS